MKPVEIKPYSDNIKSPFEKQASVCNIKIYARICIMCIAPKFYSIKKQDGQKLFCINSYKGNGLNHSGSEMSQIHRGRSSKIKVQTSEAIKYTLAHTNKKHYCETKHFALQHFARDPLSRCTIDQNVPDYNLCENIKRNVPALFEY